MPQHRFTDDDARKLHTLHAEGLSLAKIAEHLGFSRATISKFAKRLGLEWASRSQTKAATQAKQADAAALRAQLKLKLLHDAEQLRGQLFAKTTVFSFGGKDNIYREHTLPRPPADVQRNIMTSIGIAVSKSLDLEKIDQRTDLNKPAFDTYLDSLGVPIIK
ncbi:GcrA family cell cycle regulator [Pseudoclavibacter sp. CFCC 11306]|uniref:GcrA family cell cycle regulator n=1 Tax=Pseudoclavibacter sp. CFCC 11306 TaxID=1564493 RepID=UPI001300D586|nr:helix-turn-helix domain-containing protein [Pseudoclavibacter sp. CFCC 11306]KAB1658999.1 helix-turn-helix domain-containing protein [Pseudoclavibacter sp. CFCC 11306]